MATLKVDEVVKRAEEIRQFLLCKEGNNSFIDPKITRIPRPYLGECDNIRLVIIGQDPTVKSRSSREKIDCVLDYTRKGHPNVNGGLYKFINKLITELGVDQSEMYLTNAVKCFFTRPPTQILSDCGVDVLRHHREQWLKLLREELKYFQNAVVVSLGQPVLRVIVRECGLELRKYWGYHKNWKDDKSKLRSIQPIELKNSMIERKVFPFFHEQTDRSTSGGFYRSRRDVFINLIAQQIQ